MSVYIIGPNRKIASVDDAAFTCAVVYSGTTYVYYRSSLVGGPDTASQIMVTTSTDNITWTAPALAYSEPGYDVFPAGVVHNGTNFKLAVGVQNTVSEAVTTKILNSATGLTWGSPTTVAWSEYWAMPTDLEYISGSYYLAATVRPTFDGPLLSTVKTSANLSSWTSLGYPNQLLATGHVGAHISVDSGVVTLVAREGDWLYQADNDRILLAQYANGSWGVTRVLVVDGTGNPDIAPLSGGWGVIYKDQTIEGGSGIWAWGFWNGEDFLRRGTFTQNFEYGKGGSVLPAADGFDAFYSTRVADTSTDGTLYTRHFTSTEDEPRISFQPAVQQARSTPDPLVLDNFNFEIHNGSYWVSISNGLRFYIDPDGFGEHAQAQRRITAQSPFYEGTYLVHSVRENVQETVTVGVLGSSQNEVTENLLMLEELITQPSFKMRLTMQDHAETWSCQSADYTISRGHVLMHNIRATMRISVSRLPEVTYEVT